jgi:hypothetical protein
MSSCAAGIAVRQSAAGPEQPPERLGKLLRAWQLAVLRLAVTLDESDRLNVHAIAGEVDRLGGKPRGDVPFRFFRQTSVELSSAICGQSAHADTILRRYHAQIDDPRLKHAFGAAVGIEETQQHHSRRGMTICSGNCRHGKFTL